MENKQKNNMSSKRTYIATFWRSNPQLKNGGYFTTKEFQSVSLQGATNKNLQQYGNNEIFSNQVRNIVFDTNNCS